MGNAREIRRANETAARPASAEPPALPPRPLVENIPNTALIENQDAGASNCNPCGKKYVLLCAACGGLAIVLGSLFAVLYVVLRSYTSSLHYFETVPSYVASVSLIVTGLLMLCFGWRRNRFGYLVKLCGACCLVCAVVCVVITVTTTVVHMNRLQTLRECVYNARGRSCTCFTGSSSSVRDVVGGAAVAGHQLLSHAVGLIPDPTHDQGSAKYIFADTPDCEVVHGALYACLRALFGLSVIGILVSLFSGMLVYQLLGHERKKMYWEQLELRSRALFRRHHPPPCCGCCQDCRFAPASNNPMLAWPAWDVLDDSRYWSVHGGNLYSPGPCANGTSGVGAPSPCGIQGHHGVGGAGGCPAHRRPSASQSWNWLPWRPAVSDSSDISATTANRVRRQENDVGSVIIGPDDHYGFPLSSSNGNYRSPLALTASPTGPERPAAGWGPPPPYSRGSTSEIGSISASTPMGSLSPAHRSPQSGKLAAGSSPSSAGSATTLTAIIGKDNSLRKDQRPSFVSLPPRHTKPGVHPSPVSRMNTDPRRMPWSPANMAPSALSPGHSNSFNLARNVSLSQQTSPTGRVDVASGKLLLPESELYFGDSSSYALSVNDSSNSSAMYEEIHGHRYDKIQRPVAKTTSVRSGGKPCQRSSWDGQNQRPPVGVHNLANGGQPRSRHSADTVGKEKLFSPIVVPKFVSCSTQQSNWAGQPEMQADTCSFVPYRRAAVVPTNNGKSESRFVDGEVYENVTNLDFDDKKPRTLSPDEEVAILTSHFHGNMPPPEQELESAQQMDSESDDNDSMMRAVNV